MFIRSKIYSEVCSNIVIPELNTITGNYKIQNLFWSIQQYSYSWTQYDHRKQRRITRYISI